MTAGDSSPFDTSIRRSAADTPDKLAVAGQVTQTWAELAAAVDDAEAWLVGAGVGAGDRVGYLGPNGPASVALLAALQRIGAVFVGLNPRHGLLEQARNVDLVRPRLVVVHEAVAEELRAAVAAGAEVVTVGSRLPAPPADVRRAPAADLAPDDPAVLYFTSGSSGAPKAVSVSRAANTWAALETAPGSMGADTVALVIPTIAHVAGMMWTQHLLALGGTLVFAPIDGPYDLGELLADHDVTHALMVPALISMLVERVEAADGSLDLSHLREVCYGTSPITSSLLVRAMDLLGCAFTQMYGATEAGGVLTCLPPEDHRVEGPHAHRLRSAGRPMDGVEIRIVDPVTGTDLPVGAEGEIIARLPSRMTGYWEDAERTAQVLDPDGWLHLRDVGRLDGDGYLYVAGRLDDVIITGGENVHPAEVEDYIAKLDGVLDVAVFGVPDAKWGQLVVAAVVREEGADLASDEVIARSRHGLTHFKCPTRVEFVEELPRTPTGKVSRSVLRSRFQPSPAPLG